MVAPKRRPGCLGRSEGSGILRLPQRKWDAGSRLHLVAVRLAVNQRERWVSVFGLFLLHSNENKSSAGPRAKSSSLVSSREGIIIVIITDLYECRQEE